MLQWETFNLYSYDLCNTPKNIRQVCSIRGSLASSCRLALQAWNTFTRKLPVQQLGPLLSQIVYTVLPLLDSHPDDVAGIMNYLIVDHLDAYVARALFSHLPISWLKVEDAGGREGLLYDGANMGG